MALAVWHRSKAAKGGESVEVRATNLSVYLRSSKYPLAEPVKVTHAQWEHFIDGVDRGDFDLATLCPELYASP